MTFKRVKTLAGMEIDFAYQLGKELNRPVEFVELDHKALIPALEKNEIDIIMSAMTPDDENMTKVSFAMPWSSISVMLLFRRRDSPRLQTGSGRYGIPPGMKIGVFRGSPGERMVRRYFDKFELEVFDEDELALSRLRSGNIDCYFRNSPAAWSAANSNDVQLTGIYWSFTEEKTAWAVSKNNRQLQKKINKILDKWRLNGMREKIIKKWLPYKKSL